MKNIKNIGKYFFGKGSLQVLPDILNEQKPHKSAYAVFFVDHYFKDKAISLKLEEQDKMIFVDTTDEPKTSYINNLYQSLIESEKDKPYAVVGVGGGVTLDTTKALSNLLTNGGKAEDYQGWDLVKQAGIYKIGIPTISGTGAESSRTCVMTNPVNGLKLGMNSDFTLFDQLVLDPDLTATVPSDQYFYTGLDTYIHCIESLKGNFKNAISDAFSEHALRLSREVFLSQDMKSESNREKLMIASYFGGCAIAGSFVGVVHPFSAGLSVVLDIHHGLANCITMNAMEEFYPTEVEEFNQMVESQKVTIPSGIAKNLSDETYERLYQSTIIHEKPLSNALGSNFKTILTKEKVINVFKKM